MPKAEKIVINGIEGKRHTIQNEYGSWNLRDVSDSTDRTGAKWTIDVPEKIVDPTKDGRKELKFR